MKTFNFTQQAIKKLPIPEKAMVTYKDTNEKGLSLYVTSKGVITFFVRKRVNGRDERIKIGNFPDTSIEKARKKALKIKADISDGKNPNEEKRAIRGDITFKEMFEIYMERYSKKYKRSWKYDEREVNKFLKSWFNKKASAITQQGVRRLFDKVTDQNGLYQANRILERIRAIYNKHSEWGWKGENPAKGIKKHKEKSRDRFIMPNELPLFIKSVYDEQDDTIRDYFLLALLTGARKSNLLAMRFDEIDFTNAIWRIPESKNGEPINIAITDRAEVILLERRKNYDGKYVFPSTTSKSGHLEDPKRAWNRILERAGIKDLRIHDIRRTLGSYQAISGASMQIIGKSLGHKSQQATEVYSRLDLDPIRASVVKATDTIFDLYEKDTATE